jgi:hypothetical protein
VIPGKLLSVTALGSVALVAFAACSSNETAPPATGDAGPYGGADAQVDSAPAPAPDGGSSGGAWGPSKCPPTPAGKSVGLATGDQLAKLVVKDCDGNDYSLENVCGSSATWLFVAHGWCPYCKSVTNAAESTLASYAGKNVAAVNVLVENAASGPPTMTDCKAWRDTYALTNVVALYDPDGVTKGLFDAGSSALSVFIDGDRVIRSKIIHTDDLTAIKAGIDAALAP